MGNIIHFCQDHKNEVMSYNTDDWIPGCRSACTVEDQREKYSYIAKLAKQHCSVPILSIAGDLVTTNKSPCNRKRCLTYFLADELEDDTRRG